MHYAGMACDMSKIMALADKYKLWVVEDAAQAIDSYHEGKRLGTIGHLAAFSFHETKNIICGEGGMLAILLRIAGQPGGRILHLGSSQGFGGGNATGGGHTASAFTRKRPTTICGEFYHQP